MTPATDPEPEFRPLDEPEIPVDLTDPFRELDDEQIAALEEWQARHDKWEALRDRTGIIDLGPIMRGGAELPSMLVEDMLAEGVAHLTFGQYENAKSWVRAWNAATLIREEKNVLWLDMEMGRRQTANRLLALGLTAEQVHDHFTYLEFPMLDESSGMRAVLGRIYRDHDLSYGVLDAQTEAMAVAGLDDYRGGDLARWFSWYVSPALAEGITFDIIDHTGHSESGRAIGGKHKANQAKVMILVETVEAFDRHTLGLVKLTRTKNALDAAIPETLMLEMGGDGAGGFICRPTDRIVPPTERAGRAAAQNQDVQNAVRAVVPADESEAQTENWIVAHAEGAAIGHPSIARNQLKLLVESGDVLKRPGPNRSELHWLAP